MKSQAGCRKASNLLGDIYERREENQGERKKTTDSRVSKLKGAGGV